MALVHLAPGLFGRAEAPVGQDRLDVFAGVAGQRDFEIVNRGRPVERETGGVAAAHEIEQHGRQAALDDVPAHAPQDRPLVLARARQRIHHGAKTIGGEEVRQRIQQARDPAPNKKLSPSPPPHPEPACFPVPKTPAFFLRPGSSGSSGLEVGKLPRLLWGPASTSFAGGKRP